MDSLVIVFLWICMWVPAESFNNSDTEDRDRPSWLPTTMTVHEFYQNHGMDAATAAELGRAVDDFKRMVAQFYGREWNTSDPSVFIDDTILTMDQIQLMAKAFEARHEKRVKRKVVDFSNSASRKWTLPILYEFDGNQTAEDVTVIEEAIEHWEKQTCLTFRQRDVSDTEHFILFTAEDTGCWSYVGRFENTVGSQMVNLQSPGCTFYVGTPIHEIGHAVGLYHEHVRPDRDLYVDVNVANVETGKLSNFVIQAADQITTLGVSYDFSSTMHYERRAFSMDPGIDTVTPKNPAHYRTIGQRAELSFWDAKIINLAYCSNACAGVTLGCLHEGYPDPDDCSICRCPPGLGGTLCDRVAASDPVCNTNGESLIAGETDAVLQSPGFATNDLPFRTHCNWFIEAPGGCTVDFTIERSRLSCFRQTSIDDQTCQSWLEIRDMNESHGNRICCSSQEGDVLTSPGNETILTLRALDPNSNSGVFKILYKLTDAACLTSPTDAPTSTNGVTPGSTDVVTTAQVTTEQSVPTETADPVPPTGSAPIQVPVWGYVLIGIGGLAVIVVIAVCTSMRSSDVAAKGASLPTSAQRAHQIYDIRPEDARFYGYSPQRFPRGRVQNMSSYGPRLGNRTRSITPYEYIPRSSRSASVYVPDGYGRPYY